MYTGAKCTLFFILSKGLNLKINASNFSQVRSASKGTESMCHSRDTSSEKSMKKKKKSCDQYTGQHKIQFKEAVSVFIRTPNSSSIASNTTQ